MLWALKKLKYNRRFFVKRRHFKFGRDHIANLFLRCGRANTFLTLSDFREKVIISKSAGSSGVIGPRRKKTNPYALESMIRHLKPYLKLYNIKKLNIILKSKKFAFHPFLLKNLSFSGFKILKVSERFCAPHNGVRLGKKPRK